MPIGDEFKSSGITESTPENVLLGAGTIHKGLSFTPASYSLTSDQSIVAGKTYYTRSGSSPNYTYAPVANPAAGSLSSYYEATGGAWNFAASLICATSGGSKLTIKPNMIDIPVDGLKVKMKGFTVKRGETAQLEINPIEITPEILKMSLIADDAESGIVGYNEIKSRANISAGDYLTNFGFVGKTLGGMPIIVIFDNALVTSGLELDNKDNNPSVPPFVVDCYADTAAEGLTLPYHIYYPTPVSSGSGT